MEEKSPRQKIDENQPDRTSTENRTPDYEITPGEDGAVGDAGDDATLGDTGFQITQDSDSPAFGQADDPGRDDIENSFDITPGTGDQAFGAADPGDRMTFAGESEEGESELDFTLTDGNQEEGITVNDSGSRLDDGEDTADSAGADGADDELDFTITAGNDDSDDGLSAAGQNTEQGFDLSPGDPHLEISEESSAGFDIEAGEVTPPSEDPKSESGAAEDPDSGSAGGDIENDDSAPIDFSTEKEPPQEPEPEELEEKPTEKDDDEDGTRLDAIHEPEVREPGDVDGSDFATINVDVDEGSLTDRDDREEEDIDDFV